MTSTSPTTPMITLRPGEQIDDLENRIDDLEVTTILDELRYDEDARESREALAKKAT